MTVEETGLPGVLLITHRIYRHGRGSRDAQDTL
jgi:hypothetical protein